jgi:hypothetical protein
VSQIYPPSITGKGSRFPAGGSVLDHAFGTSDPFTLGVEEEYMLLDAETFDLVQHIDTVLADVSGHELEPRINAELMQSVLEVATPVCHTPSDVAQQLRSLRTYVCEVARARGMRVGSAGTHPFSLFERQRITAKDRYRALVDQMQYIARRELIFGLHVHVAVDDAEKAIQVVNGLITHLAELVALSASSAFWRGEPTGLHPPHAPDDRAARHRATRGRRGDPRPRQRRRPPAAHVQREPRHRRGRSRHRRRDRTRYRRGVTIAPGDPVPDARVWTTPNESATIAEIAAEGPMLLLFYLFDWSST